MENIMENIIVLFIAIITSYILGRIQGWLNSKNQIENERKISEKLQKELRKADTKIGEVSLAYRQQKHKYEELTDRFNNLLNQFRRVDKRVDELRNNDTAIWKRKHSN